MTSSWNIFRRTPPPTPTPPTPPTPPPVTVNAARLDQVMLRAAIIRWRERHIEAVEAHLNREIPILISATNHAMDEMGVIDLARGGAKFMKARIDPIYAEFVTHHSRRLIADAQAELQSIQEHLLEMESGSGELPAENDRGRLLSDVALVGAVATGSVAAIQLTAASAVVSAGGVIGFLGATTISLPVVVVGLLVAVAALSFAVNRGSGLRRKYVERRKELVATQLRKLILDQDDHHSLRTRLCKLIEGAAGELLARVP